MNKQEILKKLVEARDISADLDVYGPIMDAIEFIKNVPEWVECGERELDAGQSEPKTLRDDLKIVRWDGTRNEFEYHADSFHWNGLTVVDYTQIPAGCMNIDLGVDVDGFFCIEAGIDYVVTESSIIPLSELVEV